MRQSLKIDRPFGLAGLWLSATLLMVSADVAATGTSALPTPQAVGLKLTKQPGAEFTLEARQAPLAQVLQTIVDKTGTKIHYTALPEAPITANCVGASVRQIMECLIGQQLGLVARSPESGGAVEFWLLGACTGHCQEVTLENAAATDADEAMREQNAALLAELNKAKTVDQRTEALSRFPTGASLNDPEVRRALDDAMENKNTRVRIQAMAALTMMDKDNAEQIIGRGLQDKNSDVRISAVERAGNNREMLEQAMNDSDPGVSSFAAAKLAELIRNQERFGARQ